MGKLVLVIDDAEEMILLMRKFLEAKGLSVISALDGKAGVKLALEAKPDLILLDFVMPGENGVETYSRLCRAPETAVIPVVFISATMTGIIRRMVVDNQRLRFLKKPCRREELGACVDEMLSLPKLQPPPAPPLAKKKEFGDFE
ncbi:MAG: two-component system response regulator [Elusimicrobiales bacterium]